MNALRDWSIAGPLGALSGIVIAVFANTVTAYAPAIIALIVLAILGSTVIALSSYGQRHGLERRRFRREHPHREVA